MFQSKFFFLSFEVFFYILFSFVSFHTFLDCSVMKLCIIFLLSVALVQGLPIFELRK
jgi:hypothetical protein